MRWLRRHRNRVMVWVIICMIFSGIGCIAVIFLDSLTTAVPSEAPESHEEDDDHDGRPLILFWTTVFGRTHLWDVYFTEFLSRENCPLYRCQTTSDSSRAKEADLIFFSAYTADQALTFTIPERRDESQIWAFFSQESPESIVFRSQSSYRWWDGLFNWTVTYRRESDVVASYGRLVERAEPPSENDSNMTTKNDVPVGERPLTAADLSQLGVRRTAAALVSNCHTSSQRERILTELRRLGLRVDVFGRCGNLRGGPEIDYAYLARRYKFFLAFENSVCRDYVTEKVFGALKHAWIPVVLGGADYDDVIPRGSYIDVLEDRRNLSRVVELIEKLDKDDDLYLGYFEWKARYRVVYPYNWQCDLCKKLREHVRREKSANEPKIRKSYKDLYGWWVSESYCWPLKFSLSDIGNVALDIFHNFF